MAAQKRDALAELNAMRPTGRSANDSAVPASKVEPNQTMRRDLADTCRWYRRGLGWTDAQIRALCDDYTAALQREPFDSVAAVLAAEGALSRASLNAFDKKLEETCRH